MYVSVIVWRDFYFLILFFIRTENVEVKLVGLWMENSNEFSPTAFWREPPVEFGFRVNFFTAITSGAYYLDFFSVGRWKCLEYLAGGIGQHFLYGEVDSCETV